MAFPAMIFASLITALLLFALAPSSWTFWVCWLIGVISSATDPVAVVALLKELGAAKTLGTLIEGESLLNDGSAVVLFIWVKNCIGYDYATLAPEWMRGVDGERCVLCQSERPWRHSLGHAHRISPRNMRWCHVAGTPGRSASSCCA